jgi:hypothetical protein
MVPFLLEVGDWRLPFCYWSYFVGAVAAVIGLVAPEPATSGPNVILHLPLKSSRFKRVILVRAGCQFTTECELHWSV